MPSDLHKSISRELRGRDDMPRLILLTVLEKKGGAGEGRGGIILLD